MTESIGWMVLAATPRRLAVGRLLDAAWLLEAQLRGFATLNELFTWRQEQWEIEKLSKLCGAEL